MDIARQHKERVYRLWRELESEMRKWESNLPSNYIKEKREISIGIVEISKLMKNRQGICVPGCIPQ